MPTRVAFHRLGLIAFCSSLAEASVADDWPQFRGANYDNISTESGWSPAAFEPQPKILWKKEIGIGYSGPAVVGDAVYVMGCSDGEEHVRRLNAATGEVVWTHSYPGEKIDNLNAGGPGATPTVVGDHVYTNGRQGQFYCLKAEDGAVVWTVDLPKTYAVEVPAWGFTTSAVVIDGRVIVDAGRLVALDAGTGKEIWKSAEHKPGYGTPTPFEFKGEAYLAHLNNDGVSVAKSSDGTEVAFSELESQFETAGTSPIVSGDAIWASVGYDGQCKRYTFDGDSLNEVYANKKIKNHFSNSILIDGALYGISGQTNQSRNCQLVCMDFATGKVNWEQRGGGFGSLVAVDGKLFYLNDKGMVAVIPADPKKFAVASKAQILDGQCWTAPVFANGVLYCRNSEGTLAAVDLRK